MTINDVPEKYKIYTIFMSNKDTYKMSGEELSAMDNSPSPIIKFKNGEGFNRTFIVNWKIDIEATKENVRENQEEIEEHIKNIKPKQLP